METIYFAGGCFWGMEHLYRQLPGVAEVTPGYANGDCPEHAHYAAVCTGVTGFRETVQVVYDPAVVPLEHLLFAFCRHRPGDSQPAGDGLWNPVSDRRILDIPGTGGGGPKNV